MCVCMCECLCVCVQFLQQLFGISLRLSCHCNKDEHKLLTRFFAQEINATATLLHWENRLKGIAGRVVRQVG